MQVTELPFNKLIGLQTSSNSEYLLMLPADDRYGNHIQTVHASAQFALAEATSGLILFREFGDIKNAMPVVRNVEAKYKKPGVGTIFSQGTLSTDKDAVLDTLATKQRALIPVQVTLHDPNSLTIMQATFEWFVLINDAQL